MGTYFHGNSEIQGDGLQTLILMNPSYVGYSDTQHQPPPGNFVFLNSSTSGSTPNLHNFSHAPPNQTQHFVGIPLQAATTAAGSASSQAPYNPSAHTQHDNISALHGFAPRPQYNMYGSIDPTAVRETSRPQQGLSLSLSPHRAAQNISPTSGGNDLRASGGSPSSASGISNGVHGVQSVLLSSKYLKAAQELLDEVVNVGKGLKSDSAKGPSGVNKAAGESPVSVAAGDGLSGGETSSKRGGELTTVERQEIQMKKAKLVNMLDEVEQRYRQYNQQMQIVNSWFEQAAGIGCARTYTALALETISKQFRCLKDAITGQIRAATKSLGEEESLGGVKIESGSRLKFVDHHLRQQRALQQLGMIQPNAWRPQRGLPERSVSLLRAWLFEHFLHPYPKDSDKIMLAKQTGLTRSQVSNWFINARVRLWKPMVEEMYMEEVKEQQQNGSTDKTSSKTQTNHDSASKSTPQQEKSPMTDNPNTSTFKSKKLDSPTNHNNPPTIPASAGFDMLLNQSGFTLTRSPETRQGSPKKQRITEIFQYPDSIPTRHVNANNDQVMLKFGDNRESRDGFSLMGGQANFIGGFGSYSMGGEIGRFGTEQYPTPYSSNNVSLTLGLQHCDGLSISGAHHQSFLPSQQNIQLGRRVETGEPSELCPVSSQTPSHSSAVFESINLQSPRRFAAQLLPDFVA